MNKEYTIRETLIEAEMFDLWLEHVLKTSGMENACYNQDCSDLQSPLFFFASGSPETRQKVAGKYYHTVFLHCTIQTKN